MQLRLNDVVLNEQPKFLLDRPTAKDHAIVVDDLLIPLELSGVTSFFPARKPTKNEYLTCSRIELTAPDPEWKPHDVWYSEEESRYVHDDGTIKSHVRDIFEQQSHNEERFISQLRSLCISDGDDHNILPQGSDSARKLSSVTSKKELLAADKLARTWGIGIPAARKTIQVTTQRGVRTVEYPSVERRWPTGDRPLRYKRLNYMVFHDTLKSNVESLSREQVQ